jgi:hypothetical protein
LFHPHGGRVRPPEKPKNKSIILVKLLFHRKRKVSSRRFGVRNLSEALPRKNERKMYHSPDTRMHKNGRPRAPGDTVPVMKEMKEKTFIGPPDIGDRAATERMPLSGAAWASRRFFTPVLRRTATLQT